MAQPPLNARYVLPHREGGEQILHDRIVQDLFSTTWVATNSGEVMSNPGPQALRPPGRDPEFAARCQQTAAAEADKAAPLRTKYEGKLRACTPARRCADQGAAGEFGGEQQRDGPRHPCSVASSAVAKSVSSISSAARRASAAKSRAGHCAGQRWARCRQQIADLEAELTAELEALSGTPSGRRRPPRSCPSRWS